MARGRPRITPHPEPCGARGPWEVLAALHFPPVKRGTCRLCKAVRNRTFVQGYGLICDPCKLFVPTDLTAYLVRRYRPVVTGENFASWDCDCEHDAADHDEVCGVRGCPCTAGWVPWGLEDVDREPQAEQVPWDPHDGVDGVERRDDSDARHG